MTYARATLLRLLVIVNLGRWCCGGGHISGVMLHCTSPEAIGMDRWDAELAVATVRVEHCHRIGHLCVVGRRRKTRHSSWSQQLLGVDTECWRDYAAGVLTKRKSNRYATLGCGLLCTLVMACSDKSVSENETSAVNSPTAQGACISQATHTTMRVATTAGSHSHCQRLSPFKAH
jgi:hypothetical protein